MPRHICVLFDMDGTIYESDIDIQAIREALGLPQNGLPIQAQLQLESPETRTRGTEMLYAAEAEGAANGHLIPGTRDLLSWLREQGICCALITNNSRRSVDTILARHPMELDLILTREDAASKPAPDLFLMALKELNVQPSNAVAVGDTHLDAISAHRAGIREIHLVSLRDWMADVIPSDVEYVAARDLTEVRAGIETWLKREDAPRLVE